MSASNKITEYLSVGGLFNPEMMEHEKVSDLLIQCRSEIDLLNKIHAYATHKHECKVRRCDGSECDCGFYELGKEYNRLRNSNYQAHA